MKHIIRNQIKEELRLISHATADSLSYAVLGQVRPLLDRANAIGVYHACSYELSLSNVIDYCLSSGKKLYQPVTYKKSRLMLLEPYDLNKSAIFSPEEFIPKHDYEWYNLDLILLPLIAASKTGYRLGKGGGYYDTTLASILGLDTRPILCGVGFDLQFVDNIPADDWDIKLDYFASELQLVKF